jgi:hypothetical protein
MHALRVYTGGKGTLSHRLTRQKPLTRNRGSGPGVFKLSVDVGESRDSFRVQSFVDVHKHKPTGEKRERERERVRV